VRYVVLTSWTAEGATVRRVLLATLLAVAAVLTAGCGPDEPSGPDLSDYALAR
jgi:hypothetical protein